MALLISVLEQGLIYAIMAFGIYITYKILDFPDLTVDGSFPMGAAIAAALISRDVNPLLTLPICFLLGAVVGTLTGLIHVKLKVRDLLSGIIMMTALYTVNLRIAGRANLPIYNKSTIFQNDLVDKIIPKSLSSFKVVIIVLIITLISKYILDWYLRTKSGMLLRAVGDKYHYIPWCKQRKGKGGGSCDLKRPGGIKWLCVCTATAIFRCIHGNWNDGHRSCQCDHRNQPFP